MAKAQVLKAEIWYNAHSTVIYRHLSDRNTPCFHRKIQESIVLVIASAETLDSSAIMASQEHLAKLSEMDPELKDVSCRYHPRNPF